jgi:hypothetical protein
LIEPLLVRDAIGRRQGRNRSVRGDAVAHAPQHRGRKLRIATCAKK